MLTSARNICSVPKSLDRGQVYERQPDFQNRACNMKFCFWEKFKV